MTGEQINPYIDQLSDEELRYYIKTFLKEEPEAGETLKHHINEQINAVGVKFVKRMIYRTFDHKESHGKGWDIIHTYNWHAIDKDSHILFEMARRSIASGHPDRALLIITNWLEEFAEDFNAKVIEYYAGANMKYTCKIAESILDEALTHPNVSKKVKQDIDTRISELPNFKKGQGPFRNNDYLDIADLSRRIKTSCKSDEEALGVIEGLLVNDSANPTLIKHKYQLLKKLERLQEAESFIEKNLSNCNVADHYVNELYQAERFDKLIPILKDLTDPENESEDRPTRRWLETLVNCQSRLGLDQDTIETYRKLFIHTQCDIVYYNTLKQKIDPEKWPEYMDEMVRQIQFTTSSNGSHIYAEILLLEKRYLDLRNWLETKSNDTISFYLRELPQELRTDLIPIFRDKILEFSERSKSLIEYERVCHYIETIQALPEGEPIAKEIILTLKRKYCRRPAFKTTLKRIFG